MYFMGNILAYQIRTFGCNLSVSCHHSSVKCHAFDTEGILKTGLTVFQHATSRAPLDQTPTTSVIAGGVPSLAGLAVGFVLPSNLHGLQLLDLHSWNVDMVLSIHMFSTTEIYLCYYQHVVGREQTFCFDPFHTTIIRQRRERLKTSPRKFRRQPLFFSTQQSRTSGRGIVRVMMFVFVS